MDMTYILIKPEAVKHAEEIKRDIRDNGFEIIKEKETDFTYKIIRGIWPAERLNYPTERENQLMSIYIPYIYVANFGPFLKARVLLLRSEDDAIGKGVELCGPMDAKEYTKPKNSKKLRGKYGLGHEYTQKITIDDDVCEWCFNGTHRPKTEEEFEIESKIFFPKLLL